MTRTIYNKNCNICGVDFTSTSFRASLCDSEICRATQKKLNNRKCDKKKRENFSADNKITCMICNNVFSALSGHLKSHNINTDEYIKQYPGAPVVSLKVSNLLSESVLGEKNPGYKHNGKYSAWSDKSIKHTSEEIQVAKRKARENYTKDKRETTVQYWINKGYTAEEAKQKVSERQTTFSKEKCIKKYGEEKGLEIWKARQEKWQSTLVNKPTEEIKLINSKKAWSKGATSSAEKELAESIKVHIKEIQTNVQLTSTINVDILLNNKIIEYYGDYWHMNPKIYNESFVNASTKLSAPEKWKRDKDRAEFLKSIGYEILVIWEQDYKSTPATCLETCIRFLSE